ncbi:transposase [Streptomyces sp. NPDC002787]
MSKRLRTGRPIRKNKRHTVKGQWRSQITDARPIEDRPQAAENRSEFGHLEGDLVIDSNNSQVATLVDQKSRFLTVVKLTSRQTTVVVPALAETHERMGPRLRCTLGATSSSRQRRRIKRGVSSVTIRSFWIINGLSAILTRHCRYTP